jgi:hypothetical protein
MGRRGWVNRRGNRKTSFQILESQDRVLTSQSGRSSAHEKTQGGIVADAVRFLARRRTASFKSVARSVPPMTDLLREDFLQPRRRRPAPPSAAISQRIMRKGGEDCQRRGDESVQGRQSRACPGRPRYFQRRCPRFSVLDLGSRTGRVPVHACYSANTRFSRGATKSRNARTLIGRNRLAAYTRLIGIGAA